MGVIKRGILGGFSGSVANVVGSSWKGIAYMKAKPLSVANPQTTAQTNQRNAFTAVVAVATSILADWIKPLWDRFAQGMSGYNDFVSKNIEFFPDGTVSDYADLKMSIGTLYNGGILDSGASAATNQITLDNSTQLGPNGANTDIAYMIVYNETQDYWIFGGTAQTRIDNPIGIVDTKMAENDQLHAWLSYRRADGTLVSNSAYAAITVAA